MDFYKIAHDIIQAYYRAYLQSPTMSKLMYAMVFKLPRAHNAWLESRKPLMTHLEAAVSRSITVTPRHKLDPTFVAHWLLSSLEDFLFTVFMTKANSELADLASGPDFFVRQQAIIWYRTVTGRDPKG